ncbi:MAG TPA: type II methionyl aminopeptidase [Candidatus Woesearchaeota archaeon]|jgi:methionyl aminopeptidase|nr:type II methionyl aminopeptidase [Candidatus Woesearchaeota archaeon]HJO01537.1 type II methionyl aminopeptidase [Candidatus Woesearchaeota archaeon]|tara:strand:- start:670 stop:1557 length:888 start_codon:yes stop_codon:yes gene_type:complete
MNQEDIEKLKKTGKIAAQVLEYGKGLIKKDASMVEVLDKIEEKIIDLGAKPAFPAQISCNHLAAHYCPDDEDKTIFSDQIACLDVGVHVDGFIGDTAATVDLSGKYSDLVKAAEESLENAVKIIKVGVTLGEIGKAIQNTIQKYGFSPVRNLSGHGLGKYEIHTKPNIPNFDNGDNTQIGKGTVFAIEPFASTGAGIVQDSGIATIFELSNKKPVRNMITRQVLKEIESYDNLPFTTRWLTRKFGAKAKFALREMEQLGMLHAHHPLADKDKGMISQAEHSILIDDSGTVVILTQ